MPLASVNVNQNGSTFSISGVVDSHSPLPLCSQKAVLSAKVVSLSVTPGGGFSYEFAIAVDDTTWKVQEEAEAKALAAQQAAEQAEAQATAQAKAAKATEDAKNADAIRIATIAAEVAKEMKNQ